MKLIHRDLAARNVLLSDKGIVKICDFGLTKDKYYFDCEYKSSGALPVKWMAIEAIENGIFNTQTDVWSYGVVLWEIFTYGSDPYPGMDYDQNFMIYLKNGNRMSKPNDCPENIYKNIMYRCWSSDSDSRPSFNDIESFLAPLLDTLKKMK